MFIDVHCHIDMYSDTKIKSIIEKAKKSNLDIILNNAVNKDTMIRSLELSKKYPEIKSSLGIYPIDALKLSDSELSEQIEFIRKNKEKIVAIGEVGMDFKDDLQKHQKQREIFRKFIELSKELDIPIIVHSRKAELECIEILESLNAKKVIMHYFSGKLFLAERIAKNGWYLSIPSCVKYNDGFQNIIMRVPISSLLCETDSPFSHPEKKKNNTPINVIVSYQKIAEIKGLILEDVEKQIEENYKKLFSRK